MCVSYVRSQFGSRHTHRASVVLQPDSGMPTGTIKKWVDDKDPGIIGVIMPDDHSEQHTHLVHGRMLIGCHRDSHGCTWFVQGEKVEYELMWSAEQNKHVCSYVTLYDDGR